MTRWIDPAAIQTDLPFPDFHPIVGQTLIKRGFKDSVSARAFLDPESYIPSQPGELPGLSKAADRIVQGIQAGESICVWGDFDVDGQTSTTVLVQSLQAMGAKTSYHIPVRQNESHGINIENLARVIAQGANLVVTCDTGISAADAVAYANSRGVDVVISDHHDLPPDLPNAVAVVNPKMLPKDHPLATLAGVGVAYKLVEELIGRIQPANFQPELLLDLVALGLVADLAILRKDVRYLVQKGLIHLRETQRLGLKTMMDLAEISATHLTEEHIGFAIGPRLNAIGRLDDANPVVELLTTSDPIRARVLATQLEGLNVKRKLLCDQVYQAAEAQLRANPELLTQPVIILAHSEWPAGIVGIVASRIVERYHKPAILLTAPAGQPVRGSARSIEGINITAAIAAQNEILLNYGGHPMAAGLSLQADKLPEFRRKMSKSVEEMLGDTLELEGSLNIDGWLNLEDNNLELAEQLENLAPFGPGNTKLTLASRNLTIKSSTKLGKNKEHLKLTVSDSNGTTRQVIWWDGGIEESPQGKFDLAYSLRASDWHGSRQAQLEFVDFRSLENDVIEIGSRHRDIIDLRNSKNLFEVLKVEKESGDVICWAEAGEKQRVGGQDRNELINAKTLIIWTTPSSRQELLIILEKVNPEKVIVFAMDPSYDEPRALLERLTGLLVYAINKKDGKTDLSHMAAAVAQKESTTRLGLEWLSRKGIVNANILPNGEVLVSAGGSADSEAADAIQKMLESSLGETRAYRKLFKERAEIDLD